MQITNITVSAQRKLPHPSVDYANLSSFVSISAELHDSDNVAASVKKLQAQANTLVEQDLEAQAAKLRPPSKPAVETANTADRLAEKHGGAHASKG